MRFSNIEQGEEGTVVFDVQASKVEVAFLVNFAVSKLLAEGVLALQEGPATQDIDLPLTLQ